MISFEFLIFFLLAILTSFKFFLRFWVSRGSTFWSLIFFHILKFIEPPLPLEHQCFLKSLQSSLLLWDDSIHFTSVDKIFLYIVKFTILLIFGNELTSFNVFVWMNRYSGLNLFTLSPVWTNRTLYTGSEEYEAPRLADWLDTLRRSSLSRVSICNSSGCFGGSLFYYSFGVSVCF